MKKAKRTILLVVAAITAGALTCMASTDSFEPDNSYSNAASITTDVKAQSHSIDPAADEDWLVFTIETRSDVVIEISGISGDTVMWLYDDQVGELFYDDDAGVGNFSRIQTNLPTGTYYVRIKEFSIKALISEYFVSVLAMPIEVLSVNPNSATQGDSLEVTIKGLGTTFFQGSSTITNVWLSKGSPTIDANSFTGIDATTLEASFDIPVNALAGKWNVHVSNTVDGELPSFADGFMVYAYPDLNGDGKVDAVDFALLAKHWLEVVVPNVTGMPQSEAQAAIVAAFLVVGTITQDYDANIPSGNVISSEPVAGTKVSAGSAVNLLISTCSHVPNVIGMPQSEAQPAIVAAFLVVGTITQDYDANIPSGNVVSSEPVAGTKVSGGSAVNLLISMGPVPSIVPNVIGMTKADAEAAIVASGLTVGSVTEGYSETVAEGNIIGQNPSGGEEVPAGSTVNLVVSKGAQVPGMESVYIDNDPGVPSHERFTGYMSKYETTNAQYCQFLNSALDDGLITVYDDRVYATSDTSHSEVYFDTYAASSYSQITYSGGVFSVRSRDGYDMSNHPVVKVSWYGATAFCNYYGCRLPTEWEWQAVADYDGSYIYGCGTTLNQTKANYDDDNPIGLPSYPFTSPVGYYPAYGYGMCHMAGNVWEWTSSCYFSDCSNGYRVIRGGGWLSGPGGCRVAERTRVSPSIRNYDWGFRVVLDLN